MAIQVDVEIDFAARTIGAAAYVGVVQQAVETILRREGFVGSNSVSVTVLLTGDERLRSLNREFAGEDHVTDVLSFSADIEGDFPTLVEDPFMNQIGDIAISVPQAKRQALAKNVPFERELAMLAIHGTLHLVGQDHQTPGQTRRMRAEERRLIGPLWPEDPRPARGKETA